MAAIGGLLHSLWTTKLQSNTRRTSSAGKGAGVVDDDGGGTAYFLIGQWALVWLKPFSLSIF
jgi:hypothetical protein